MKITGVANVFQVKDLKSALAFYRDVLGFEDDFQFGQYAGIHLGEFCLHLCAHTFWHRPVGGGAVSIFADEVDSYHAAIKAKGAAVAGDPADRDYGMRDFAVLDPDGNVLTFGCAVPEFSRA